jgi:dTMP kinase
VLLKEPSDGPFGSRIRKSATTGRLPPLREHKALIKDREWDCRFNIRPALEAGKLVVMDRYVPSNLAYQGALGLPLPAILADNQGFPPPDLILFLKVDLPVTLERIQRSARAKDGFEGEGYLAKVAGILDSLQLPNTVRLDATIPEDELAGKILSVVQDFRQGLAPAARAPGRADPWATGGAGEPGLSRRDPQEPRREGERPRRGRYSWAKAAMGKGLARWAGIPNGPTGLCLLRAKGL